MVDAAGIVPRVIVPRIVVAVMVVVIAVVVEAVVKSPVVPKEEEAIGESVVVEIGAARIVVVVVVVTAPIVVVGMRGLSRVRQGDGHGAEKCQGLE